MTLYASNYIDRVRRTLFDPAPGGSWTDDELLTLLNAAQRAVVGLFPGANTAITNLPMDPGTYQELPTDGLMLLEVYSNSNHNAVTLQSEHEMARVRAGWGNTPRNEVKYVFYDVRKPRKFSVYPKASSGDYVRLMYSRRPDDIVSMGTDLELDDIYETAIWAFMCGTALMNFGPRRDAKAAEDFMKMFNEYVVGVMKNRDATRARVDITGAKD